MHISSATADQKSIILRYCTQLHLLKSSTSASKINTTTSPAPSQLAPNDSLGHEPGSLDALALLHDMDRLLRVVEVVQEDADHAVVLSRRLVSGQRLLVFALGLARLEGGQIRVFG